MCTFTIPLLYRKDILELPGAVINSHLLEQPMSRTNYHGPKDGQAIEVRLYMYL